MTRASIQMQFNWVFVLIAGAVILAAFFGFIMKQKAASDQKIADTLIKDIETLATVAASSKGAEPIQTPNVEVTFACDEDCSCNIEVGRWTRSFKEKLIFSPTTLKGTSMLFWSMDWKVPFRVTNFLLLTNREVKYFFVYANDAFAKSMYQKVRDVIPESIDYEFSKADLFKAVNEDYEKVRFVFLGDKFLGESDFAPLIDKSFEEVDVSVVIIRRSKVHYFTRDDPESLSFSSYKEFPNIGDAVSFAAMFAESQYQFECNMRKAYKKLANVAEILEIRTGFLDQEMSGSSLLCGYDDPRGVLDTYVKSAMDLALTEVSTPTFDADALKSKNEELLLEGCPLIY